MAEAPLRPVRRDGVAKLAVPTVAGARGYAIAVTALVVAGLALLAGANQVVDPRSEFASGHFRPLAPDWPLAKLDLYDARLPPPQALVLGTSRGMTFGLDGVDGVPANATFNFAFPGGEVPAADLVLHHAEARAGSPKAVLYVLDQFALREQSTYRIQGSAAYPRLGGQTTWADIAARMPSTLTPSYVHDTAKVLAGAAQGDHVTPRPLFTPNGFYQNRTDPGPGFDQQAAIDDLWARVLAVVYGPGGRTDAALRDEALGMVSRLAANGTEVTVLLPPFHPAALARLAGEPAFERMQTDVLAAARQACAPHVRVFDYTDIGAFGGDARYFSDAYHVTPTNAQRIEQAMVRGEGDLCAARATAS